MPRLDTLVPELVQTIATHVLGTQQRSHRSRDLQALRLTCRKLEQDIFKAWTSSYSIVELNDQDDIDHTAEMLLKSSKVIATLDEVIVRHDDQLCDSQVRQILATVPKLQKLHVSFFHDVRDPAIFDVLPEAVTCILLLNQRTISKEALQYLLQRTKCRKLTLMINDWSKEMFQVLLEAQLETLEVHMSHLPNDSSPQPERLRGPERMTRRVHSKYRVQMWKMANFHLCGYGPEMVKNMIERVLEIYESEPKKHSRGRRGLRNLGRKV